MLPFIYIVFIIFGFHSIMAQSQKSRIVTIRFFVEKVTFNVCDMCACLNNVGIFVCIYGGPELMLTCSSTALPPYSLNQALSIKPSQSSQPAFLGIPCLYFTKIELQRSVHNHTTFIYIHPGNPNSSALVCQVL